MKRAVLVFGWFLQAGLAGAAPFAQMDDPSTPVGYLARLLINENPFPGEKSYVSEADTKAGMLAVLWVLHSRIHHIPAGYKQEHIATLRTKDVLDVITAKGQFEGFFRDVKGRPSTAPRVEKRVQNLLRIANMGDAPGRFAGLVNHAQGLAEAYMKDGIQGADRFVGLDTVNRMAVTGRAYAWMTDTDYYKPGGNYVAIPDSQGGSPGGNRFYTLRKEPQ